MAKLVCGLDMPTLIRINLETVQIGGGLTNP